jgi:hypothetical protein
MDDLYASPAAGWFRLESLPLDAVLIIASSLPPTDLLALGVTGSSMVEISRADQFWTFHLPDLKVEHPKVTVGCRSSDRPYDHFIHFRDAIDSHTAQEDLTLLADYRSKPRTLRSLEKSGTISDCFTGMYLARLLREPFPFEYIPKAGQQSTTDEGSTEEDDALCAQVMMAADPTTLLCEHHIADFQLRTDRYARAFAVALPDTLAGPGCWARAQQKRRTCAIMG